MKFHMQASARRRKKREALLRASPEPAVAGINYFFWAVWSPEAARCILTSTFSVRPS